MHAISRKARNAAKKPPPPPPEPVVPYDNAGYERWLKQREEWNTPKPGHKPKRNPPLKSSEMEELYKSLVTGTSPTLPRPVPLSEFIPCLVEIRNMVL